MFYDWLSGMSAQGIARLYGLSVSYTYKLLHQRLKTEVKPCTEAIKNCKYAIFDGKFLFGRKKTALVIFDASTRLPIAIKVCSGENKREIKAFLIQLKQYGFNPLAVTTDGKSGVGNYFTEVFPKIVTQRCLFHIKMQILSWVRIPPRCPLGFALRDLVEKLLFIDSLDKTSTFIEAFNDLLTKHADEIKDYQEKLALSPYRFRKERDLLKCLRLIENALPDMFSYLHDPNIAKTSSALEGFNKKITKISGFDHCGLTENNLEMFLQHYLFMTQKTSTK